MHVKQWVARLKKSAGPKKHVSPGTAQIAAVSVVVLLAVGAIIVVAHQATPANASPSKSVAVSAPAPAARPVTAPSKKGTSAKAKTANAANAATAAQLGESVTISGCLEQKNDEFRLKDTDAPKARSWKSLGLAKHSATVSLVDASNRLKLGSHVGERVSVTGTLIDKELQGKSLKALAPACE